VTVPHFAKPAEGSWTQHYPELSTAPVDYTDSIEAARRRKPTSPAAEIQQNLFPPRIARIAGGQLAGVLLPSYDVGGDWFDFVPVPGGFLGRRHGADNR